MLKFRAKFHNMARTVSDQNMVSFASSFGLGVQETPLFPGPHQMGCQGCWFETVGLNPKHP